MTEKGTLSTFVLTSIDPTMGRIFGPALAPQLNLITCWGQWDGNDYNERLVIYSMLVGAAATVAPYSHRPVRQ